MSDTSDFIYLELVIKLSSEKKLLKEPEMSSSKNVIKPDTEYQAI